MIKMCIGLSLIASVSVNFAMITHSRHSLGLVTTVLKHASALSRAQCSYDFDLLTYYTSEEIDAILQKVKEEKERFAALPRAFYEDRGF